MIQISPYFAQKQPKTAHFNPRSRWINPAKSLRIAIHLNINSHNTRKGSRKTGWHTKKDLHSMPSLPLHANPPDCPSLFWPNDPSQAEKTGFSSLPHAPQPDRPVARPRSQPAPVRAECHAQHRLRCSCQRPQQCPIRHPPQLDRVVIRA